VTIDGILAKLEGVRASGNGWSAQCPAHEDNKHSFSIANGDNGGVVVKCHLECSAESIVDALGLKMSDLMPERDGFRGPEATYPYLDETGVFLFEKVRFPGKEFRLRNASGEWSMKGVRRVPYRLNELQGADFCFVVEGEKDADNLAKLGLKATTGCMGAGSWTADHARDLKQAGIKRVAAPPDNDEAGRKYSAKVAKTCLAVGITTKVIQLPGLPPKGDVSDWLAAGGTAEQLMALVADDAPTPVVEVVVDAGPVPELITLLDATDAFIRRFVVLKPAEATMLTLWVAQTHSLDAFDYTPYLHITSPFPECGKTRTLEVLESLVPKPWMTGRVTAAVLMRKVDALCPTLLLDESDAAFSGPEEYSEALRGLLNTGFSRHGVASACVGQGANINFKDFNTFCPKAIAGIGRLPGTVESRSIPIVLKRRTSAERVKDWRRKDAWAEAKLIRDGFAAWGARHTKELAVMDRPVMPEGLSDRTQDVLEGLLTLADAAGGHWPKTVRAAAETLMGSAARSEREADQSIGLELLDHIRQVFVSRNYPTTMSSADLLAGLLDIEDGPWKTCSKGEPLNRHRLGRLLHGLDIPRSVDIRFGSQNLKGYYLANFEDAFQRYLPNQGMKALQARRTNEYGPEMAKTEALQANGVALPKSDFSPMDTGRVAHVALSDPDPKESATDDDDEPVTF